MPRLASAERTLGAESHLCQPESSGTRIRPGPVSGQVPLGGVAWPLSRPWGLRRLTFCVSPAEVCSQSSKALNGLTSLYPAGPFFVVPIHYAHQDPTGVKKLTSLQKNNNSSNSNFSEASP